MRGSPYTDLSRPPLQESALRRALTGPDQVWRQIEVVPETGSTNADLAAAARGGAEEGLVLIAENQTAGRGRLERHWLSPARAGITLSVLLRPGLGVPPARLGWLPLLAGVALAQAVGRIAVVDAALKWPNDLLVRSSLAEVAPGDVSGYGKCGGVLAEAIAGSSSDEPVAIVLGMGLNVSQRAEELPPPPGATAIPATSLALVGAAGTDRDPLVRGVLRALDDWYDRWRSADGDPLACGLLGAYRSRCVTLGQPVAVTLPGGEVLTGTASDVDEVGRLMVATPEGRLHTLAAGDVRHVR
ncbi:MAG TPA: biotin--[acetyl-CoA-carboxylase] ligase [Micromonosporaceae bacterium]